MWHVEKNFKVKLGGNYYINIQHLIECRGESLFRIFRREEDELLAVDFDVYRADGSKVATIRNAHIVSGNADDYEFKKEKHRYWIIEKSSGRVICDIKQVSKAEEGVELDVSVDLFTKSGFHLVAGPEETNIGGLRMRGCTFENGRVGVSVG